MELARVHYCWRKRCFGGMLSRATDSLLRGVALSLTDRPSQALASLSNVASQHSMALPAHLAMLYTHNQCQVVDREAVAHLERKVVVLAKEADSKALYCAALVHYLTGAINKAKDMLDRHFKVDPESSVGLALHGWMLLGDGRSAVANKTFQQALKKDDSNILAMIGIMETSTDVSESLKLASSLVVRFSNEVTPLLIRMDLELSAKHWSQSIESANRALAMQPKNIHALLVKSLRHILDGKYDEGAATLSVLREEATHTEGNGAWKPLLVAAQALSRSCGRSSAVLSETLECAKAAVTNAPHLIETNQELAYQYYLAGNLTKASSIYRELTSNNKDHRSVQPIIGLTMVQMLQLPLLQVRQQVDFLSEVSPDIGAVLWMKGKIEGNVGLLDKAVSVQQSAAGVHPYGPEYLAVLDLDLLNSVAQAYPHSKEGLKRKMVVLGLIVDTCPGDIEAGLSLAKAQISGGELLLASETIRKITDEIDSTNPQAHLLLAEILIEQNLFDKAESSLELGLSYNLKVREVPQYHMLLGLIQKYRKENVPAVASLKQALQLNKESEKQLNEEEMGKVYEELTKLLIEENLTEEAKGILEEAESELKGSPAETRLLIAQALLACHNNQVNQALMLLSQIEPSDSLYLQAQMKKADIYLKKLNDGEAYADCYKKLVALDPSPENLILLGDAYIAIQESELAVESYERAMKGSAANPRLSCRLGRLLVKCHQYAQAIKCYRDSGEEGCIELAELLLKLGQMDKAESCLAGIPLSRKALILAKVLEKSGEMEKAMNTLKSAYEQHGRTDVELGAKLCYQLAVYSSTHRDFHRAIEFYKKALSYQPEDTTIQIALAKLHLQVSDWSSCESVCSALMAKDNSNEPALLMLADLAFRRTDLQSAAAHFMSLLERRPDYWLALARLIQVLRRTASLDQAQPFIELASQTSPNEAGLAYCKGLYHWYRGNTKEAMENFNECRSDTEWGPQAVVNMVELCISLGSAAGLETAQRLLGGLRPTSSDQEARLQLLVCFVRLATQDKAEIERALIDLTHLANNEAHRIGATLGLATGYHAQKQLARVKNVLKRVAKTAWVPEEADYLERCWLMLAETYIGAGGKSDLAVELLRRVIAHNQSAIKAYELLAVIADKEQRYSEAGEYYSRAWELSGEKDPMMGYKLGLNLVKSKKYSEAIATCQTVLRNSPNYPKIRKDVLDKAMAHLRA